MEKRPREAHEDGVIRKDRPQAKGQDTGIMKEDIKLLFFLQCFWVVLVSTPSVTKLIMKM